jgi:hypothetical protein
MLSLGDKNAVVLLDVCSNREVARFPMGACGENVQFLSLTGTPACSHERSVHFIARPG